MANGEAASAAPAPQPPATAETTALEPEVRAAGAVLWRDGPDGRPEVAVVHRPRYDDWSLPKGKLDQGELAVHAAVREVAEETGFSCVLSRFLTRVDYWVLKRDNRVAKHVDYFAARARSGSFTPNSEVDELRWMTIAQAREQVSYSIDLGVLDAFESLPTSAVTVLLVRHAKAGDRAEWSGNDDLRPLSQAGRTQRDALRPLLLLFGPERVHSAPPLRCAETVAPVAGDLGVDIVAEPLLSEEGYWPDPEAGMRRFLRIATEPGTPVISSQGEVIPDLVRRLAEAGGLAEDELPRKKSGGLPSKKGSVWVLTLRVEANMPDGSAPAPRLAAAYYLADAVV